MNQADSEDILATAAGWRTALTMSPWSPSSLTRTNSLSTRRWSEIGAAKLIGHSLMQAGLRL